MKFMSPYIIEYYTLIGLQSYKVRNPHHVFGYEKNIKIVLFQFFFSAFQ